MAKPTPQRTELTPNLVTAVEPLEPRSMMSAAPAGATEHLLALDDGAGIWRVGEGVLVIRGTRASDVIAFHDYSRFTDGQTHHFLRITFNGDDHEIPADGVSLLRINARGGDDTVYMTTYAPPMLTVEDHEIAIAGRVRGGPGRDTVRGGSLNDTIDGGGGNDWLSGEHGDDRLVGGPGGDILRGEADDDTIRGAAGDDQLDGGIGADALFGGAGNDRIANREPEYESDAHDLIFGGEGRDRAQFDDRDQFKAVEERTDDFYP